MILIKNGRVIDPASGIDATLDVLLDETGIQAIEPHIAVSDEMQVIDAKNLVVAPGLIDNHVHFRDPGLTYKEDLVSGANAAKAGGFTTVVCMANTAPVVDNVEVLEDILTRAKDLPIHVLQCATVTKGMQGKEINDLSALKDAGAIGFTDDGIPLSNEKVMLEALEVAHALDMPISLHEEAPAFVGSAGVNAGKVAETLGIKGASHLAEDTLTARDCLLAKETGARIDIQHLSSGMAVDLIRFMKSEGVDVWGEVTPQHLLLTEDAVLKKGALAKVNPPLRREEDRLKLIAGLQDGTIDMIVTDHAPHAMYEKDKGIKNGAPSGMIGLETSLAICLTALVKPGYMSLSQVIEKMTIKPAQYYRLKAGTLSIGAASDVVIFDPKQEWTITEEDFYGKSKNSPFVGTKVNGRVKYTICEGKVVFTLN